MRIAIPKGRLQEKVLAVFAAAGYDVPTSADLRTRKLVFQRGGIEWIFVKDCDVPVYVEHGAADAGVAGLDQILEHECSAYQPVELPFGRCRMMLIGAPGAPRLTREVTAKIATKYPRIARQYLDARALRAELVPLAGSVELAAVLSLTSHVIDLVETGTTVRVHRLELQDLVAEITPRLIVAKNVYRTEPKRIRDLIARIEESKDVATDDCVASNFA
ncbi:MAG: phosphoribosyltransferase [Acidobacteriota bacterium]|jgi:ATP phosphoribosyltransferase|nr:phosphoribosyltransferase [Acidobacteriota bacterium]